MTDAVSLTEGLSALRLEVPMPAQKRLLDYLQLLAKWNRTHNLTAIREPAAMMTHHLLDSLAVLAYLDPPLNSRWLDVGSGAGLPGIPLAIARPDWHVTLLDSNRKKAAFLRQAAIEIGLSNVEVACERIETYAPETLYAVAISRAFSSLANFAVAARVLVPGGRLAAMKGAVPHDEIDALPDGVRVAEVHELRVPGVQGERHLVIMEATAS